MLPTLTQFLALDLAPLLTAAICAVTCAVLGNFLLLRRQSLMGDAISHAVLPGLAAAFLITASRGSLPMFLGALVAGIATAGMTELVRRTVRVDPGAAMGVVFSVMFALGVLLMSLPRMQLVDLDADCVLSGVLETILWAGDRAPTSLLSFLDPHVLSGAPRQLVTALGVAGVVIVLVLLFYKELRLTSFDPGLAAALGFRPALVNMLLMILIAAASVASFEAVGSILVVAMLICPAATARMFTDRLHTQIALSAIIALFSAVAGYLAGAFGPPVVGLGPESVSAAGMMTVVSGLMLAGAIVLSPSHGLIARRIRLLRVQVETVREDLLALLYRAGEAQSGAGGLTVPEALSALPHARRPVRRLALRAAIRRDQVRVRSGALSLTDAGLLAARALVRTHRLWETYLVDQLGLRPDHVHRTAMDLEHVTTDDMRSDLSRAAGTSDPHGRPIP